MKTIKLSQASRPLSEYAMELNDEVMVITDGGKSVAAIVPLGAADQESVALSTHPEFLDLIARSRREIRSGRSVTLDAMKRQFLAKASPNTRLQPTKARRRTSAKPRPKARLRG